VRVTTDTGKLTGVEEDAIDPVADVWAVAWGREGGARRTKPTAAITKTTTVIVTAAGAPIPFNRGVIEVELRGFF
jgi:hypothetical protein